MLGTVCKQFIFAASHQLPNHDGPCHDLHGHTYKLEVIVTGKVKGEDGSSDEAMVIDFTELKRIYEERVAPHVDHKHLNEILTVPTSEAIATWIWWIFCNNLDVNLHVGRRVTVRLWESPTSYAEVGPAPWRGNGVD